jgi:hypothetical protein
MKQVLRSLTLAAVIAGALAAPAAAQQRAWGFGIHGSYLRPGQLAEAEPSDNDLKLDNGWSIGGGLEGWFGSRRWGLRLDGAYTNEPYVMTFGENDLNDGDDLLDPNEQEVLNNLDVTTWFADADLMLRLLRPEVDRRFAPFVSVGTGLVHWRHNLNGDADFDGDGDSDEDDVGDVTFAPADAFLESGNHTEWALTGGIGTDIFFNETVALRLEAKDYWTSDSPWLVLSDMDRDHEGGHNVMWRAGLQFNFGGARVEEPGFVETPPPPPPPAPAPAPEPEPATERVTMCVVGTDGRLQTVDATRYIDSRQIVVSRNGEEVAFSTVHPVSEPLYIRSANWYVTSRPFIIDMDADLTDTGDDLDVDVVPENRIELVTFGTRAPLAASEMTFVGTIDGTPVYARTSDLGGLRVDLDRELAITSDLGDILDDEDEFTDRFVNEVETLYMVVEPGEDDCVFQPVSSTRVVRRTNG